MYTSFFLLKCVLYSLRRMMTRYDLKYSVFQISSAFVFNVVQITSVIDTTVMLVNYDIEFLVKLN